MKTKQTAIFSADVAEYSRLMCCDEINTVIVLNEYLKIMSECIHRHGGCVVDTTGDNLLADFGCAADSVLCAVEVQQKFMSLNKRLPIDKWMQFRIGINYDDVIEVGRKLYGTGVNVAARLESKADPGGVCISRAVVDKAQDQLPFQYEYLGSCSIKNICKFVDIFKIIMT